jgi:hypothetical protein
MLNKSVHFNKIMNIQIYSEVTKKTHPELLKTSLLKARLSMMQSIIGYLCLSSTSEHCGTNR